MHLKSVVFFTLLALANKCVNAACSNAWAQCGGLVQTINFSFFSQYIFNLIKYTYIFIKIIIQM